VLRRGEAHRASEPAVHGVSHLPHVLPV